MINKADLADPVEVAGLRADEKGAVVVSARTGAGLDGLRAELDRMLPRRDTEVCVLVPYDRGDLVSRAHDEGEVLAVAHGQDGTELTARVPPALAAELCEAGRPAAVTAGQGAAAAARLS